QQQQQAPRPQPQAVPAPAADAVEAQPVISQLVVNDAPVSEQAQHEQIAQQGGGHGPHGERHAEGGARRGRRRGRRGGRRRRFEERAGAENGGQGTQVQGKQGLDPNDDNRGNVGEQYYRDLTEQQDHEADARSHSHDVHDHAHVAAPAEPRPEYHEPANAAEHDDRTMPNPYRIPEGMSRQEPDGGHGGGNEGGDGGGHHE
ncbi:MAG TPA: hypothetical protein VGH71_00225, partial [Gammaproteobacteria bacterium]